MIKYIITSIKNPFVILGIYPRRISHSKLPWVVMCHPPALKVFQWWQLQTEAPWKVGCHYGKGPMVRALPLCTSGSLEGGLLLWERPYGQAITPVYLRLQTEFPGHNGLTARPSFVIIVPPSYNGNIECS
jgi:hypothetical protein